MVGATVEEVNEKAEKTEKERLADVIDPKTGIAEPQETGRERGYGSGIENETGLGAAEIVEN